MVTKAHVRVFELNEAGDHSRILFEHEYTLDNTFNKDGSFSVTKERRNLKRLRDIKETLKKVYPEGKLICNYSTIKS